MVALLIVLYATLVILLGTSLWLIIKKDGNKHDKITLVATISMSVATIGVGISTVNATKRTEILEKNSHQPLFSVKIIPSYSEEKAIFDNEEYMITNEGNKTKVKTCVVVCSFLEIEYKDTRNNRSSIRKIIPISYFNGVNIETNNLDGVIEYSEGSNNNNECFFNLYKESLKYSDSHPGIFVTVQDKNYFILDYIDIYGEKHRIVKTEENEIDPNEFMKMKEEAVRNAKGNTFMINKLNLNELIALLFEEK